MGWEWMGRASRVSMGQHGSELGVVVWYSVVDAAPKQRIWVMERRQSPDWRYC